MFKVGSTISIDFKKYNIILEIGKGIYQLEKDGQYYRYTASEKFRLLEKM